MKIKKYEISSLFIFLCVILILLEIVFFIFLMSKRIVLYEKIQGIIVAENKVSFLVNKEELRWFYNNETIYIDDNKKKFKIIEIENDILKKDDIIYHEILIEVELSSKYKINDALEISILNKKVKIISMFRIIWREEY